MKEKAPRRARPASKSATESPITDVPCAPADACRDAQPDAETTPATVSIPEPEGAETTAFLDAITEAAVARATEAALGRVAAIVGPALERIESATAALSPDRITLRHPSGAAIEIGFSALGFPLITLRDTTGTERLKMGLGMYHPEDLKLGPGEPLHENPTIEMLSPAGTEMLTMEAGSRHVNIYARQGSMTTEIVPTEAEILGRELSSCVSNGVGASFVLKDLLRFELQDRANCGRTNAWDAKLKSLLALLEAPLP